MFTKQDAIILENDLRDDMKSMETGIRNDMKDMESRLRNDMKDLESRMDVKLHNLETKLLNSMNKFMITTIKWVIGITLTQMAIMVSIMSYFASHH